MRRSFSRCRRVHPVLAQDEAGSHEVIEDP
jgi:hypothetical protein